MAREVGIEIGNTRTQETHRGGDRLARSLMAAVLLAGAFALGGPLLSYRSDLSQLREVFQSRILREAELSALVLSRHLHLLEAELVRLAHRPEVDPMDAIPNPEQELLDLAHRGSTLFGAGVSVLDRDGRRVWSEPDSLFHDDDTHIRSDWFQALRAGESRVIDAVSPGSRRFLVGVPVIRDNRFKGAVVGVFDPEEVTPPQARGGALDSGAPLEMVVVDESGDLLVESQPPPWATTDGFADGITSLLDTGGPLGPSERELFAVAVPVGDTGLTLILAGDESSVTGPLRERILLQLGLIGLFQISAVGLLALFLRRTYRRFHEYERRSVAEARLVALGSAASLIAHEVKNSLNGLKAGMSLIASGADLELPLRTLRGQVDRLQHLASSLLLFGRPGEAKRTRFELPDLIRGVTAGLSSLPEADEVEVALDLGDPLEVDGDPMLVATAADNLIRNAVEAVVAAKDLGNVREPWVRVRVRRDGADALIDVEDNGGGPAGRVRDNLFQPFITGKAKGIGLGLATTRRVLELQGGEVTFEPTPEGSRFSIRLTDSVAFSQRPGDSPRGHRNAPFGDGGIGVEARRHVDNDRLTAPVTHSPHSRPRVRTRRHSG